MALRRMTPVFMAALLVTSIACEDVLFNDPEHTYTGPPMVEFAPVLPAGNYVRTITLTSTTTTNQNTFVRVNYIAQTPTAAVTGTLMRVSTSTAVEGTHYRIPGGTTYTIAAGAHSVDIPIEVIAAGFTIGTTVSLVLELEPGTGFQVSEKYKRFTFTLRK